MAVIFMEMTPESELLIVPSTEISRGELKDAAFHPDVDRKKGGSVAFSVPLVEILNS